MNDDPARPWPRAPNACIAVLCAAIATIPGACAADTQTLVNPIAHTVADLLALDAQRALQHERQTLPTAAHVQTPAPLAPMASPPTALPVLTALYGTTDRRHGLYAELATPQGRWMFRQGRRTPLHQPPGNTQRWALQSITPPCVRLTADPPSPDHNSPPFDLCLEYAAP